MTRRSIAACGIVLVLTTCGCRKKQTAAVPPAPQPQNIIALLEQPDGKSGAIVITNSAGTRELRDPNQAVRVERSDTAPGAPYALDGASVRALFGVVLDALPTAEAQFVLYFDEGTDQPNAAAVADLPKVLAAIQERQSTLVTVIGHTDTTGSPESNYALGLRRAQAVAAYLRERGIPESSLFVESHGEGDLLVPTPRGKAEARNRRVEVVVR